MIAVDEYHALITLRISFAKKEIPPVGPDFNLQLGVSLVLEELLYLI